MGANPTTFTSRFNALFFCSFTIFEKVNKISQHGQELRQARKKSLGSKRLQSQIFEVRCPGQSLERYEKTIAPQKGRQTSFSAAAL